MKHVLTCYSLVLGFILNADALFLNNHFLCHPRPHLYLLLLSRNTQHPLYGGFPNYSGQHLLGEWERELLHVPRGNQLRLHERSQHTRPGSSPSLFTLYFNLKGTILQDFLFDRHLNREWNRHIGYVVFVLPFFHGWVVYVETL